jgi:hypothetical protein
MAGPAACPAQSLMTQVITKAIVALTANSQPYWKIKSDFFVRDHWRASEENNLLGSGILCTVPEFHWMALSRGC